MPSSLMKRSTSEKATCRTRRLGDKASAIHRCQRCQLALPAHISDAEAGFISCNAREGEEQGACLDDTGIKAGVPECCPDLLSCPLKEHSKLVALQARQCHANAIPLV